MEKKDLYAGIVEAVVLYFVSIILLLFMFIIF